MSIEEFNKTLRLIRITKSDFLKKLKIEETRFLKKLAFQKLLTFETYVYERTGIKVGCTVKFRDNSNIYYVGYLNQLEFHYGIQSYNWNAVLYPKSKRIKSDGTNWNTSESYVIDADIRLIQVIEEHPKAREMILVRNNFLNISEEI